MYKRQGTCTDREWPHRYIIEIQGDDATVHVEQLIDLSDDKGGWFSWGKEVKTHKVEKDKISFSCPWGGLGKALTIACSFKFGKITKERFDATLTIESFKEDKLRNLRFVRVLPKDLSPTFEVLFKQEKQDTTGNPLSDE